MKFQFYYEKLLDSEKFKKFIKENKDAYPCTGFISLDKGKQENNIISSEYFIPETKKIASFKVTGQVEMNYLENNDKRVPEKLSMNYTFDTDKYEEMILREMENKKIKGKIQKLLYSLQSLDKKPYLLGTIFLSNLGLLKVHIDIDENKIVLFEKKSFFDIIKIQRKHPKK